MANLTMHHLMVGDDTWEIVDASARQQLINAVFSLIYSSATVINNGTDLNSLTTPGNYRINNAANAGTLVNAPISVAFRMIVFTTTDSTRAYQIVFPNTSSNQRMYVRNYISTTSGWSNWLSFATNEEIGVLSNLSTSIRTSIVDAINELVDKKAPIISPTFTGTPMAPTPTAGTNTDQIATTSFVKDAADTIRSNVFDLDLANVATITSGTDLDNVKTPGNYRSTSASITNSLLHKPSDVTVAFRMIVFSSTDATRAYQVIFPNTRSGIDYPKMCIRNWISTDLGWSEWQSFVSKDYVDNKIPAVPSQNGTYTLKATVSDGSATYAWISS